MCSCSYSPITGLASAERIRRKKDTFPRTAVPVWGSVGTCSAHLRAIPVKIRRRKTKTHWERTSKDTDRRGARTQRSKYDRHLIKWLSGGPVLPSRRRPTSTLPLRSTPTGTHAHVLARKWRVLRKSYEAFQKLHFRSVQWWKRVRSPNPRR